MKGYLSGIFLMVMIIGFFVVTGNLVESELFAWQNLASPGELSTSHSLLKNDCGACHTAVKGPSPEKCMACHLTDERLSSWPALKFHLAVPDCRRCHREHLGTGSIATKMDHNQIGPLTVPIITSEAELRCVACHLERDPHTGMFGPQCSSCHNTQTWIISKYRHPSDASTDCSQCHRAPPCHQTEHFKRVCMPVAGQLNAIVPDCQLCHQVRSWNSIKGVGWYKSH